MERWTSGRRHCKVRRLSDCKSRGLGRHRRIGNHVHLLARSQKACCRLRRAGNPARVCAILNSQLGIADRQAVQTLQALVRASCSTYLEVDHRGRTMSASSRAVGRIAVRRPSSRGGRFVTGINFILPVRQFQIQGLGPQDSDNCRQMVAPQANWWLEEHVGEFPLGTPERRPMFGTGLAHHRRRSRRNGRNVPSSSRSGSRNALELRGLQIPQIRMRSAPRLSCRPTPALSMGTSNNEILSLDLPRCGVTLVFTVDLSRKAAAFSDLARFSLPGTLLLMR